MMKNYSATKKSLLLSAVSLIICIVMLIGNTFAWFTDSVESNGNVIMAGDLDVELDYYSNGGWHSVDESTKLFDENACWEPGHTEVVYLRVSNEGSLALKYLLGVNIISESGSVNVLGEDFMLSDYIKFGVINNVKVPFETREAARKEVKNEIPLYAGYQQQNPLLPESEPHYVALVVYMPESVGNEANHAEGKNPPEIDLGISLVATQYNSESDYFGPDYDEDSVFPSMNGNYTIEVDISDKLDANNQLTEDVAIGNSTDDVRAAVPKGASVAPGATKLVLTVKTTDRSGNIEVNRGQASRSLDVHIDGLAEDNTVPAKIDLGPIMPTDLKNTSVVLYHVEDGTPVAMASVDSLTAHNQFVYDSASGEISLNLATFSEVTAVVAVNDPWAGGIDISWYNTTDTSFTITTEEQFAGFGAIVGGMAKDSEGNVIEDTFAGKTVILGADLDLGGLNNKTVWYPIGYKNSTGSYDRTNGAVTSNVYSFEGTFDGQNHTIANIYQNTWDMFGDYNSGYPAGSNYYKDGMGIFGFVYNGTVKNLTVNNFQSDGEFATTGVVAAYASGTCTFDNIKIVNSNPRAYNVPNGGVVGYAYNQTGDTAVINFNKINVGPSNKISALWGSWDVGCGGILGRVNGDTTINMTNCDVGAVIDVFNDVCGNYQYYQYRYSGMLIGTVGADRDSTTGPEKVNFSNVNVYIGNWADYYYCEFEKNSVGSYTDDYQFSRVEKNEINIDPATNLPYTSNVRPCRHQHTTNEDKMGLYLPFNQLYTGYSWGATAVKAASGVNIVHYFYTVTYMDGEGKNILETEYVTGGERSETKLWANEHTTKTSALTTNEGKKFVGWVNTNSEIVKTIPAGNYKDVVLYESWENPYIIRFVDVNGKVIYSEVWTEDNLSWPADKNPPDLPEIDGYVGEWETGWRTKLQNVTADVTIRPVYMLDEVANQEHIVADGNMTAAQLFEHLENGKSIIMGSDITGSGKNDLSISGNKHNFCEVGSGDNSRLNINSFDLTCTFDHNANKSWHVFDISNGGKLTLSGGVYGDGTMVVNFKDVKSPVYLFNIGAGGTLVLEAGLTFEIHYPAADKDNIYGFAINGKTDSFANYDGIYVDRDSTSGVIKIVVGVTTTITENGVVAKQQ